MQSSSLIGPIYQPVREIQELRGEMVEGMCSLFVKADTCILLEQFLGMIQEWMERKKDNAD